MPDDNNEPKKQPAHLWKKGQSGNPGGRPRRADALSERIRELMTPDVILGLIRRVTSSPNVTNREILQAVQIGATFGYTKPAERHEVVSGFAQDSEDEEALDALTLDELRLLRELGERRAKIIADAQARERAIDVGDEAPALASNTTAAVEPQAVPDATSTVAVEPQIGGASGTHE